MQKINLKIGDRVAYAQRDGNKLFIGKILKLPDLNEEKWYRRYYTILTAYGRVITRRGNAILKIDEDQFVED